MSLKRIQRFNVGDTVDLVRGGVFVRSVVISEIFIDPHPIEFAHCGGNSARYRGVGYGQDFYDWMAEPNTAVIHTPGGQSPASSCGPSPSDTRVRPLFP